MDTSGLQSGNAKKATCACCFWILILLSVLTGSGDSGVNALKQHRKYKNQRLPDIFSSFRDRNFSSDMTSYSCKWCHATWVFSSKPKRQEILRCVNVMRCPKGLWPLGLKNKHCWTRARQSQTSITRTVPLKITPTVFSIEHGYYREIPSLWTGSLFGEK